MSVRFKTSFPYRKLKIKNLPGAKRQIVILRPIIPVMIIYGKRFAQTSVLLDSGADFNVFHGDVAAYLGIKLTAGSKRLIYGIKGKIKGYEHKVSLKIDSYLYETKAIFSNQIPNNSMAVLGNKGFFDKFEVHFRYKQKLIELSRG